eukprot:scaffold323_cov91-Cyclotella_meneghiniana.AAC.1
MSNTKEDKPNEDVNNSESAENELSAALTPAASLLPRKRHATKSPVPPGSLESAEEVDADDSTTRYNCQGPSEENPFLTRNLHSAFDSSNKDEAAKVKGECNNLDDSGSGEEKQQIKEEPGAIEVTGALQQETPTRIQQQLHSQQHTPLRQPKTQKQKRYRQSNDALFSPKPMNRRRESSSSKSSSSDRRPPRPGAALGEEFTQSPEISQESLPLGSNESYDTINTTATTGSGYESSPATPFRFHGFPASLPRVHLKNDGSDNVSFSSTPFRLNESSPRQRIGGDTRKYLKPKPTPSNHAGIPTKQPLPPLSPATRKLFNANKDNSRQVLPMAPSFETVDEGKDQDISGDWSDSGMSFTNERMKMATTTTMPSIPSHVTSHTTKMPNEEELDTMMEGDDIELGTDSDLDRKMPARNVMPGSNLFYSPPQDSEVSNISSERTYNQSQSVLETTLHPHTPRALPAEHFDIHNLQVSPIIRGPEDDVGIVMKSSLDDEESFKERTEKCDPTISQQHLFRDSVSPRPIFSPSDENEVNTTELSSASTANINNTTMISNLSSTTRPQTRKIRPMPDTSAFDMSTPGSRDSGSASHKTSTSGLMCPPTPIRTPAWAHAEGRPTFQRANSLISTKVLAACPPRVLDNLSSLEDSMLENDISGYTLDHDSRPALNSSFTPVDETDEQDSFDNDEMLFPLGAHFGEHTSPIKDTGSTGEVPDTKQDSSIEMTTNKVCLGSVSFSSDFTNLGILGSGAFADVYKVRSKRDQKCYAIKRTRRQFRGVKDRERAMAEVQTMQRLQADLESLSTSAMHERGHDNSKIGFGLYLLFFIQAWQEDGYFFCQTELCSRATCRQLRLSLTTEWVRDVTKYPSLNLCLDPGETDELKRLLPERVIWQVCHDISRGTTDDGQEGDTAYMPNELLTSCAKHPGADIFSLGLTLYELAAAASWTLPREGERWHTLRSGAHNPNIPGSRKESLVLLIQSMLRPKSSERPSAEEVSEHRDVKVATALSDSFLSQYVKDVEHYDSIRERDIESAAREARRRSSTPVGPILSHHSGSDRRSWSTRTPTNESHTPNL